MVRYFIHLAYKGTNYHGWQIQPNGITIQELISKALTLMLGMQDINLVGAGRTDTGVHSRNYYAHFDCIENIQNPNDLVYKLNSFLPKDIAVYKIFEVNLDAHARFDAISRTYRYYITTQKSPFSIDSSWYIFGKLDVELMKQATNLLLGKQDFTSFSKLHTQVNNNFCHVKKAQWVEDHNQLIFEIQADRFLRNMVRSIVGTMVMLGRRRIDLESFKNIIAQKDRREAGESAPAQGLFLEDIEYNFNLLRTKV